MEKDFIETLKEIKAVTQSGTSSIHLCGDDYNRIDVFIECLALALGFTVKNERMEKSEFERNRPNSTQEEITAVDKPKANIVEWNYGYGQVDFYTREKINSQSEGKIPFPVFLENYKAKKNAEGKIILIRNARHVLEGEMNRENLAQLQQTIVHLRKFSPKKAVLIYCDEKMFVPDELSSLVYFLEIKPPSRDELENIAIKFINKNGFDKTDPESLDMIYELSSKCVGLTEENFLQILEKAKLDKQKSFAVNLIPFAEKTKKQLVDKSGLLKYVNVDVNIDNVGGLGHLKWWLLQKKKAFEIPEEARKRGINPAKGILLVGMPGCGKSITSKAIADFFKLPLLSLDLGSLMGKYLGESEENLRRALKLAENSSPCVLWVDEIEKAFAGVGGDDSGVSQRLFGYLLTWLNEKTSRVFVMATANDVAVLPPEFLRRGRFDEIFYVDFPNAVERQEIFKIHLGKTIDKEKLDKIFANEKIRKDFEKLISNTEGYSGSDIESLVNSANERAWNQGKDPLKDIFNILLKEREYMTPLKEVLAEKIARNKEKFGQYKLTPASENEKNLRRYETYCDGNIEQQLEISKEDRCPASILIKLAAKDRSKEVRLAVLDNPNCPLPCIYDLMEDNDQEVKEKATGKHLKISKPEKCSQCEHWEAGNCKKRASPIGSDLCKKVSRIK